MYFNRHIHSTNIHIYFLITIHFAFFIFNSKALPEDEFDIYKIETEEWQKEIFEILIEINESLKNEIQQKNEAIEKQNEEYLARFEKELREHPDIQDWHLMSGAHDYILRVRIASIDEYGVFHRDVLSRLPGVSRITSSFAIRSHCRL